jgi:hypothetical protein
VRAISRLGIEDAIATIEDEIARVRLHADETLETSEGTSGRSPPASIR